MCSGRPAGADGGRSGPFGRDGRQENGSGFSAPCWTGSRPEDLRAPSRAVLQSPAAASLLRPHAGRVQAGRGLLLRHLLLLSGSAERSSNGMRVRRNNADGAGVSCLSGALTEFKRFTCNRGKWFLDRRSEGLVASKMVLYLLGFTHANNISSPTVCLMRAALDGVHNALP